MQKVKFFDGKSYGAGYEVLGFQTTIWFNFFICIPFFFLSQACNAPKVHFSMLIFCFYDIRLSKSGSWKGVKCFNAENVI